MRSFVRFYTCRSLSVIILSLCMLYVISVQLLNFQNWYYWCNRMQNKYLEPFNIKSRRNCTPRNIERGIHQRVIVISMFGPKENTLFQTGVSLSFLKDLILDAHQIYPGWVLRIYHDSSVDLRSIRELQCSYDHVDFYYMSNKSVTPPRMWRFLSIGDPFVDICKYHHFYCSRSVVAFFEDRSGQSSVKDDRCSFKAKSFFNFFFSVKSTDLKS